YSIALSGRGRDASPVGATGMLLRNGTCCWAAPAKVKRNSARIATKCGVLIVTISLLTSHPSGRGRMALPYQFFSLRGTPHRRSWRSLFALRGAAEHTPRKARKLPDDIDGQRSQGEYENERNPRVRACQ